MAYCGQCGTASSGGAFCTQCGAAIKESNPISPKASIPTTVENKSSILGELWTEYKDAEGFKDYIDYNDLGLPLAYAVSTGIIEINPQVQNYIEDSFTLLLDILHKEDEGFEELSEILE
ncbi:hypothetical protein [Aurantimicrobium minutum]|uniref:Zinc ribbon domain-containing protein n=1 Tax=Aurantimicrobium minutum TaxID=708131 RepID=A0A173LXT6_9MICO|nr:hypothetical protein [Aurantimicrobium minutum]BAU99683.1 Uncharacterized protein AUMI_111410 [Aurantimicrobium minutum]